MGQLRPLLRWAGSKKRQFATYSRYFPEAFSAYVEPFAGSAAFLFGMRTQGAKLNDINRDVMDFYGHASASPEAFYKAFLQIDRNSTEYYITREKLQRARRSFARSVMFYYLNRNCFNGIYRVNRQGHFNVPFSDNRVSPYLSQGEFVEASSLIFRSQLSCRDFEVFCDDAVERRDFVFIDPPYYSDKNRIFAEYNSRDFDRTDVERLLGTMEQIDHRRARFLLSFPAGELAQALSRGWHATEVDVTRTVAGNFTMRRTDKEVLISNYGN